MPKEIESIHDIEVEDVQTAHDFNQLVSGLREYAENRAEYKESFFEEQVLADLEAVSESVYQQLAVVYAQAQEDAVDPESLIDK